MLHDLWRKCKTEKSVKVSLLVVVSVLLLSGGSVVYAKYFSQGAQWGIAIASGVYFTANYAAESEEFFECIAKYGYTGGSQDLHFEVRNYENYLLFNESSVVIPYSLSFWLGETPTDATYTLVWEENGTEKSLLLAAGQEATVMNTIAGQSIGGGGAYVREYTIKIVPYAGQQHTSIPIYVEVRTDEDAIIEKTLRGKIVMDTAILSENYIESQEFVVPVAVADDTKKFEEIEKLSMLTYEIRTVGDVASEQVTEKLKLSWDPELLEINLFDDAYLTWLEEEEYPEEAPYKETVDGKERYYITMDIMPYSAQTVSFFRGAKYNESVKSMDDLENEETKPIWAEKLAIGNEEATE